MVHGDVWKRRRFFWENKINISSELLIISPVVCTSSSVFPLLVSQCCTWMKPWQTGWANVTCFAKREDCYFNHRTDHLCWNPLCKNERYSYHSSALTRVSKWEIWTENIESNFQVAEAESSLLKMIFLWILIPTLLSILPVHLHFENCWNQL